MTDDLIAWLRAQLDDDERAARSAAHHDAAWRYADSGSGPTVRTGTLADDLWSREGSSAVWTCDDEEDGCPDLARAWEAEGEHIARWDPARVLAEIDTKRRILDRYTDACARQNDPEYSQTEAIIQGQEYEDWVIPLLAQPYADRPGYRDEWRI